MVLVVLSPLEHHQDLLIQTVIPLGPSVGLLLTVPICEAHFLAIFNPIKTSKSKLLFPWDQVWISCFLFL